jgi:ADP-heptose:LPS heptosyltransferase
MATGVSGRWITVGLAKQLQADARVQIWVSGSEAEGQQLRELAPELFALPNVASLCGQVDLAGLIELIGHCGALVASGTGPLHLAAALGKPTLGLFPPLKPIDPVRWAALGVQAQNLALEMPCQCPPASTCACMAALSVAQVHKVVQDWVARWEQNQDKNQEQNREQNQGRAI